MGMGKTIQTIALLLSDEKSPNLVIAPTVSILLSISYTLTHLLLGGTHAMETRNRTTHQ